MKKILRIFNILINLRIITTPLKKNKNLILDSGTGIYFKKFFPKNTIILNTRYEELYLKNFINSFLLWLKNRDKTLNQVYILSIIKEVNPKNIITFSDYNPFFLKLKHFFKSKNFFLIQSHIRSYATLKSMRDAMAINNNNKKFNIDYTFIWGTHLKKYYEQFLNTKFIVTGSFKNYIVQNQSKNLRKDAIVYISQFRKNKRGDFFNRSYETNHKFRQQVLLNIWDYCKKNNLKLFILINLANNKNELLYYKNILSYRKFKFLKKKNQLESYKKSKQFKYFFTIGSSFGYEMAGLKKYICFAALPIIEKIIFGKKCTYNYQKYKQDFTFIKKRGEFWTNTSCKKEIFRILDYMIKTNPQKKRAIYKKFLGPYILEVNKKSPKYYLKKYNIH